MKYKYSFMIAFWWIMLAMILGVFLLICADKEDRASTTENRMLQGFPEMSVENVFSGNFGTEFEAFLSDGFFLRESIVETTEKVSGLFSRMTGDDRYVLDSAEQQVALQGENAAETLGELPQLPDDDMQSAPAPARQTENVAGETVETKNGLETGSGSDYLDNTDAYQFWLDRVDGGKTLIYTYERKNIEVLANTLNAWAAALPENGNLYYALIPFASTANRWTQNTNVYCGWSSNAEYLLAQKTADNVYIFNAPDILREPMSRGEVLYYRTDHHWAPRGAYYVAMAMIQAQGYPATPYEEYEYKTTLTSKSVDGGFRDTLEIMYPLLPVESQVIEQKNRVRTLGFMNYDNASYQAYLYSTQFPWRKFVTGYHTGKKCLVVCDSFGNVFSPFLMPYYDEVHMVDLRVEYCDMDLLGGLCEELIEYHDIDDVYILYSTANGLNSTNSLVYLRRYFNGE